MASGSTRKFSANNSGGWALIIGIALAPAIGSASELSFKIPPISTSVDIAGQQVPVTADGVITDSGTPAGESGAHALDFSLRVGLAGLQEHITPLLAAELNRSERCGNRIQIQNAALAPGSPSAQMTVRMHVEKWACIKAFGRENAKRLVGGDATAQLSITPVVETGGALRLNVELGRIDADGSLGELLRSGALANTVRDKIRESLEKALAKSSNFETTLPAEAQPYAKLGSARFADAGDGRLILQLTGQLTIPAEKLAAITAQFKK